MALGRMHPTQREGELHVGQDGLMRNEVVALEDEPDAVVAIGVPVGTAVVSREEAPAEAYEVLMPEPTLQTDNQEDTAGGKGGNQNVISEDASAAETPVQIELQEEESEKSLIQITTTGYDYDLLAEVFSSLLNKETSPAE